MEIKDGEQEKFSIGLLFQFSNIEKICSLLNTLFVCSAKFILTVKINFRPKRGCESQIGGKD